MFLSTDEGLHRHFIAKVTLLLRALFASILPYHRNARFLNLTISLPLTLYYRVLKDSKVRLIPIALRPLLYKYRLVDPYPTNILPRWSGFMSLYYTVVTPFLFLFYYSTTRLVRKMTLLNYQLLFIFKTKRLFINFYDFFSKVYFTIAPGHFLKFLNKKKSYKKSRTLLSLMVKFVRKLFIVTRLKTFNIVLKKSPYLLNEVLNKLFQPLNHRFVNPLTGAVVDEITHKPQQFNINLIFFKKTIPYSIQKTTKKGRLKRKIFRQIVRKNNILD